MINFPPVGFSNNDVSSDCKFSSDIIMVRKNLMENVFLRGPNSNVYVFLMPGMLF